MVCVCVYVFVDRIGNTNGFFLGIPKNRKMVGHQCVLQFLLVKQIFYGVVVHQCVLQSHLVKQIF